MAAISRGHSARVTRAHVGRVAPGANTDASHGDGCRLDGRPLLVDADALDPHRRSGTHGTSSPAQVSSRARRTATASASAGTRAPSSTCSPEQGTCIDGGHAGGHSAAHGPRAHLALRVDGRRLGGRAHSVSSAHPPGTAAPTVLRCRPAIWSCRASPAATPGQLRSPQRGSTAGSDASSRSCRRRQGRVARRQMPSQWPTASSGRRGGGTAPAQRRARRLVPARKRRWWPLVAMVPARTCHAWTAAEPTAAPARPSGVPAPNPVAPMGRVADRRCPHVCGVRRSLPLLQHSALAHAVWRVDGTGVSGTLAPGDGGAPSTPRADGRRRRPRWPRQPREPCSCTECSSTSGGRHYPRRLQQRRPPRPERARARAGQSAHAATAAALGPHAHVRCRRRPAQRQRVHGSFVLPRVYSVPRTTYWRSGLAAAPPREPAQENQMKLFVVPTLRPHRRQD